MDHDSKRMSTGGTTDRLSNLPCNIIGQILALLPLKEAAKTSVLSKKWEDKWLTIPHLVFDGCISESTIYHVLLLHKEPIVKFTIEDSPIEVSSIKSQRALCHWFNFLSKHKIEELTILQLYHVPRLVMPCHLFRFYNLKFLCLEYVEVRVPLSIYNEFSNLISINFVNVDIKVEELQRLVWKCPKLESLTLANFCVCTNSTLHISTHNQKSFQFLGTVGFVYIYSNPHLEDVSIFYSNVRPYIVSGRVLDYVNKFFGQLSMIKKLEVNCHFLKDLGTSGLLKLPQNLNHLKHIQFLRIHFDCQYNVKAAICLIRSSPNLRSIVIMLKIVSHFYIHLEEEFPEEEDDVVQYLKDEQKLTPSLSSSLEKVKFDRIYGWPAEMEFVKLLLLGATKLREVKIDKICCKDELSVVRELASFRRASSEAVILTGK